MPFDPEEDGISRRSFLRTSTVLSAGVAAVAAGLAPLRKLGEFTSVDQFLQKYYKELTPEEMKAVLERIEAEVQRQYGIRPHVRDYRPMNGVEYVYALNLTRCVGCRKCVHACVAENNQSRNPEIQYIRVLKMPNDGTFDVDKGDHNYAPKSVPEPGFFFMPVQCHQCKNPPCVKVCPVKATWQEPDGITVIDYNWCIGCRYCEAACPYFARRFNFAPPRSRATSSTPTCPTSATARGTRAWWRSATSASSEAGSAATPRASRSARRARASSATSSIPRARCPIS